MSRLSSLFGLPLVASFTILLIVAVGSGIVPGRHSPQSETAELVIEHAAPLSLTLKVSQLTKGGIIELTQTGSETIHVSVPEQWQRTEVSGVPLEKVTAEEPALRYVRWTLPNRATVRFSIPSVPSHLALNNPSLVPISLQLTRVDVPREKAAFTTILLQQDRTLLW